MTEALVDTLWTEWVNEAWGGGGLEGKEEKVLNIKALQEMEVIHYYAYVMLFY